ncbi:Isochorismatase [[Actinobacillus] muris]|uniref:Isochorismatase n=1 Tax=Muribacter muris TaxID=67855 RepID=A0A0J5P6W4_9PAST|nr:cysteine hydrolase family protein [Muribacter muris]KMK51214.1 Isochorismatase [[Actinobacillus] muris] [Muribacter muris]
MKQTALLIVDFQNDYFSSFTGAKWALSGTEQAAENGVKLLTKCRSQGVPVFHIRHEAQTMDALFFQPNSEGAKIHASMQPLADEVVITKHQINSFRETDLHARLQEKGIRRLIVIGAMSHMCIDAAVRAAVDLGYQCDVAFDACATLDLTFNGITVPAEQVQAAFMAALQFAYANVVSTTTLLAEITAIQPA